MGYVRVLQMGGGWPNGGAGEVLGPPMGPGGKSMGVQGSLLTPGATQGGIGAAHGPRKQFGGSTGVSCDPSGDSWRCRGVPLTFGTTQRVYWGIPWPFKQNRGIMQAGMYITQPSDLCT